MRKDFDGSRWGGGIYWKGTFVKSQPIFRPKFDVVRTNNTTKMTKCANCHFRGGICTEAIKFRPQWTQYSMKFHIYCVFSGRCSPLGQISTIMVSDSFRPSVTTLPAADNGHEFWYYISCALPIGFPPWLSCIQTLSFQDHFPRSRYGTDVSGCVRPSSNYSKISVSTPNASWRLASYSMITCSVTSTGSTGPFCETRCLFPFTCIDHEHSLHSVLQSVHLNFLLLCLNFKWCCKWINFPSHIGQISVSSLTRGCPNTRFNLVFFTFIVHTQVLFAVLCVAYITLYFLSIVIPSYMPL